MVDIHLEGSRKRARLADVCAEEEAKLISCRISQVAFCIQFFTAPPGPVGTVEQSALASGRKLKTF
jgi:hypothetical protein